MTGRMGMSRALAAAALAVWAASAAPARAGGDDKNDAPAPRAAVDIGGVSVVLIVANGKLVAFLDRIEDNAPVAKAALDVLLPDGTQIAVEPKAEGFFAAPYDRAGRVRDAFLLSLRSADGSGEALAEIKYDDDAAAKPAAPGIDLRTKLGIAAAAAAVGALLGGMAARRWGGGRLARRGLARTA